MAARARSRADGLRAAGLGERAGDGEEARRGLCVDECLCDGDEVDVDEDVDVAACFTGDAVATCLCGDE